MSAKGWGGSMISANGILMMQLFIHTAQTEGGAGGKRDGERGCWNERKIIIIHRDTVASLPTANFPKEVTDR